MPSPAQILCHKHFEFEDGSHRDKWFVVLNNTESDISKPCLTLKTTSVSKHYTGSVKGCNKNLKVFFAPMAWQTCFSSDTFIQLPQIYPFSTEELLKGGLASYIEFRSSLSADCFAQLKNCLAMFKIDIAETHWDLIFK